MLAREQKADRNVTTIEFPSSAQEHATLIDSVLWDADGRLNVKVLELLSLSPSIPQAFRQDFVSDMLDVIEKLISAGASHATIATRIAFESGGVHGEGDLPKALDSFKETRRLLSDLIEAPHSQCAEVEPCGQAATSSSTSRAITDEAIVDFMEANGIATDLVHSGSKQKKTVAKGRRRKQDLTIEQMWEQYLKTRPVAMRNRIVVHYSELVHTHAARLSRKLPTQISYDEICSAAFDGLIEAVEAYDPERKAKFETFCQQRISGAIMDWLRSLDPQARTVRTFEKEHARRKEATCVSLEWGFSAAEVARRLQTSLDPYEHLARLSQLGKEVHFSAIEPPDEHCHQGSSRTWNIRDTRCESSGVRVSRQLFAEVLTKGLAREERMVLVLYYYEGMTMAEIGCVLDLSETNVCRIHTEILQRLRNRFNADSKESRQRAG